MDIYTITIAISLLVYLLVGNYAGRGVRKLDDYFVAGRRAPTLLIVGTLVASLMSSTMFLGEAGFTYDGQMGPFVLFPQTATVGYIIGALLFGRYLRRSAAPTVADYFRQRFNSRKVQVAAGLTIIVGLSGYLVVVTQGAAILLTDLTAVTYTQSLVLAWISYTAFTMYSGSRGVILTDTIMFLLFTVAACLVAAWVIDGYGGLEATVESLARHQDKPDIASWHGIVGEGTEWPTPMDYLIWDLVIAVAWGLVYTVSPWQAGRHLMARDEHVVLRSAIAACIIVGILQVVIYGLGGIVNLSDARIEPSDTVIIWATRNLVPDVLGALLLAGIMAAALSSASTFMSLVGFSASNDVIAHHEASEEKAIRFSRLMMLGVGIFALAASLIFPPSIFWITYFVAGAFASSWGPVGLMSVWSSRITSEGAFWGMIVGFVFNVVPTFFDFTGMIDLPSYLNPILIGVVASYVVIVLVSRKGTVSREERDYRMRLHETPASEIDAAKTGITLWAPMLVVAYGVVMPFLLLRFYVRPYQQGTGELTADGGINWLTGEAILPLTWALLYIPLGIIVYRVIRRGYDPGASR